MSPRRNHPRRRWPGRRPDRAGPAPPAELDLERARRGVDLVETWQDEQWRVRMVPGSAAVKSYRCPGCDQEIRPGVPHLVVWPLTGPAVPAPGDGPAERRHWHSGCWQARDRRRPSR
jgi:hypothetical protein